MSIDENSAADYLPMILLQRLLILASALLIVPALAGQVADIIFINGDIYTVDAKRSWADAVAIQGNRIIQVGSDEEVLELRGENTHIVDLEDRMMLPGFQDSHVHPIEAGMGYLGCSLHQGRSAEDYADLVANCCLLYTSPSPRD